MGTKGGKRRGRGFKKLIFFLFFFQNTAELDVESHMEKKTVIRGLEPTSFEIIQSMPTEY